jgi:hypothetical protein
LYNWFTNLSKEENGMRKSIGIVLLLTIAVLGAALVSGCEDSLEFPTTTTTTIEGATTTTTSTTTTTLGGMALEGKASNLASASALFAMAISSTEEGNTNYSNKFLTPESYAVGIWKFELLRGTTDSNPYVAAEFAPLSSEPVHFAMSSTPTNLASNPDYPDAGTYDVCRPTLGYLEMEFATSEVSFGTITKFRLYTSTVGTIQDGDVLVDDGGTWKWLDSATGGLSASRPASPVQDEWFSTADSPDPFAPLDTPMNSLVIPASPEGQYVGTISFDVTDTFFFDDVDDDGVFEPATDDVEQPGQGAPSWFPGPPSITLTVTNET